MTQKAWVVRISERESLCFEHGTVAIGWAELRGSDVPQLSWEQLKARIREHYPAYSSPQALGQVAGILWRFLREIQIDDWIVAPTRTGLNIAVVTGSLIYDESLASEDSAWRYPVRWVRLDVSREAATGDLRARCSSRQTCVEASEYLNEIQRLSRAEGKPNLARAILNSEARASIGAVLDSHLTPDDLELLVVQLAQRSGATVERPAKNYEGKVGDVDVVARYSFPPYVIGYQVKKHEAQSTTDVHGVQQLIEAMDSQHFDIDIGCVITTAGEFSSEARSLAASRTSPPIRLMVRDDLVQWLLSAGVHALE